MKEIATENLRLVVPTLNYAGDVFDYASDPEFCQFIDARPAETIDDAKAYLQGLIDANNSGDRVYWLIEKDNRCVGSLGFNMIFNPRHRTQDFGYGVAPGQWGQGVFSEAATAIVNYGFEDMNLDRIQASTRIDNIRSVEALKRLGFETEAVLKRFYSTDEGRADCAVLALFRADFR